MKLFEYAIILDEKRDKDGEVVEKAELLAFDKALAKDGDNAQIIAARAIPEQYLEELDRVTIAVRPF